MTGPEHYREAERLVQLATRHPESSDATLLTAAAQVHATLALAAAQAGSLTDKYVGDTNLITAWSKTTGTLPQAYDVKDSVL